MSLSGSGPRLSLGERALQEATRRMRAGSPCKRRRLHPQKPLSITDVLLGGKRSPQHSHRCSLSASGRASGQARLRRRFSRLGLTPFTRRNIIGHVWSFRGRPRRLALRRARRAPRTGFADASSGCYSERTMPRRQKTTAKEPRGRSASATSESPRRGAASRRNRAKTRTHDDAESRAGPVGGAARRLGGGNVR